VLSLQLVFLVAAATICRHELRIQIWGLLPFLCLAAWSASTILWADDPFVSLKRWLIVFVPGLLMTYALAVDSKPNHKFNFLIYLFSIVSITSAVFNFVIVMFGVREMALLGCDFSGRCNQKAFDFHFLWTGGLQFGVLEGGRLFGELEIYIPRYSGITSNPNSVGLFSSLSVIGLVAITKIRWNLKTLGPAILILAVLCVLISSGSRAAYLMTIVGIFMVVTLRCNYPRLTSGLLCLVLISPVLLYGVSVNLTGEDNIAREEILAIGERGPIWATSIYGAAEVWKTGLGFGLIEESLLTKEGHDSAAHSVPLTVLVETGILGLMLYIMTWFWPMFRSAIRSKNLTRTAVGIFSLLVALFVHQLFDSAILRYHWLNFVFTALLGLALSVQKHNKFYKGDGGLQSSV